jgi:hypothetical protein
MMFLLDRCRRLEGKCNFVHALATADHSIGHGHDQRVQTGADTMRNCFDVALA